MGGLPDHALEEVSDKDEVLGDDRYVTRPIRHGDIRRKANERRQTSTRILDHESRSRIRREEEARRRAFVEVDRVLIREERAGTYYRQESTPREENTPKRRGRRRARQMKRAFVSFLIGLVVIVGFGFIIHHNSYQGIVNRGNQALGGGQLLEAESLFRTAIERNPHRYEGIVGLSQVYLRNNQINEAEGVLLGALDGQVTNIPLYEAIIQFYLEIGQYEMISQLLDGADPRVLEVFEEYVSPPPTFSLQEGTFHEVQELAMSSEIPGRIHYTVDGGLPNENSSLYGESLLLNQGEHNIRAIFINERGIPSVVTSKTFTIQFNISDAPAVTPSTGLYHEPTQIMILVPYGYTAFFTLDGSIPTVTSHLYEGPVEMEEGNTIFTAILMNNGSGRMTATTVRNFTLELE
jgi:hypothetical protein